MSQLGLRSRSWNLPITWHIQRSLSVAAVTRILSTILFDTSFWLLVLRLKSELINHLDMRTFAIFVAPVVSSSRGRWHAPGRLYEDLHSITGYAPGQRNLQMLPYVPARGWKYHQIHTCAENCATNIGCPNGSRVPLTLFADARNWRNLSTYIKAVARWTDHQ